MCAALLKGSKDCTDTDCGLNPVPFYREIQEVEEMLANLESLE